MSEAPEKIWIAGELEECGCYYSEAVEAEGEHGGTAQAYHHDRIVVEKDEKIERLRDALLLMLTCDLWPVFSFDAVKDVARAALRKDGE